MTALHAERPPGEAASVTTRVGDVVSHLPTERHAEQQTLEAYARELAENARDHGLAVAEAADAEWADRAYAWIEGLEPGAELDADDLRFELGRSSAAGSVFRRASRAGLIEPIGISTSRAVTRHGGISRRWRRSAW